MPVQAMRERAAAFGVAALHWEELANGEHAAISHGAAFWKSFCDHVVLLSHLLRAGVWLWAALLGYERAWWCRNVGLLLTHIRSGSLKPGDKDRWLRFRHPRYCFLFAIGCDLSGQVAGAQRKGRSCTTGPQASQLAHCLEAHMTGMGCAGPVESASHVETSVTQLVQQFTIRAQVRGCCLARELRSFVAKPLQR